MALIAPTVVAPSFDENALSALLDAFYARVRDDALFSPLFSQAGAAWRTQVRRLADFWSSMMANGGHCESIPRLRYPGEGQPITAPMFERWGALWREVTAEMLPPAAAAAMQVSSRRISISLQRALGLSIAEA